MRRRTRRLFATALCAALVGAVFATPASAAAFETFPIKAVREVVNPCTGEWTVQTLSGVVHVREQLTPGGTFHVLERFDVTWSTDDGFAGTARQVLTVTDRNPGNFDDYVLHLALHFIGRDGSGRVVQTRELVVLNLRDGDALVEAERFDERCSGRR
jgi:hypothetical protein